MSMKSALRDWLFVSYGMISILVISRCAAPPYPAAPDFPPSGGQNKTPRNILFISSSTVSTGCCATSKRGKGGGASHQRGNAGVVHEVYDSLFFSSNSLFPLEGKCHVVAKGCTGQSNDVILYRYPDRQSAASLATSWSSPPCKQVALVLISAVVKVFS